MSQSLVPPVSLDSQTLNMGLNRSMLNRHRVHRVRRVLYPSWTKRPDPRSEPDLVQRGLLLLWALLFLQIYTEDSHTELQCQGPDIPDLEPQESAPLQGTAQNGAEAEPWGILTTTDVQMQCVVA